jgi:nucleoside-diphosphate-sugar epimerase
MARLSPKRVLVTGAYGLIGNLVYAGLAAQPDQYEVYGLDKTGERSVRTAAIDLYAIPAARRRLADISDLAAVTAAVDGMEVVVHLAADPNGAGGWESVLQNNIIGARNVFEASRLAGAQRVIFASTNQVVFGYDRDAPYAALLAGTLDGDELDALRRIDHTQPPRPPNEYACSKVFGEALAYTYAYSHGLSCLCVRVGWVVPDNRVVNRRGESLWCSHRDIVQIMECCIQAPASLRFDVFFGQSDNRRNLVDIGHAREVLGYAPQDRAEERRV